MNLLKILVCCLFLSLLVISCGSDDSDDMDSFFFEATIDGESFRTESVVAVSLFTVHSIVVTYKDDEEFQLQLNGLGTGTYEALGTGKILEGTWNLRSPSSGALVVTSFNEDTKVMEGTVNVTFSSGLPGVEDIVITNGRFRVKFPF